MSGLLHLTGFAQGKSKAMTKFAWLGCRMAQYHIQCRQASDWRRGKEGGSTHHVTTALLLSSLPLTHSLSSPPPPPPSSRACAPSVHFLHLSHLRRLLRQDLLPQGSHRGLHIADLRHQIAKGQRRREEKRVVLRPFNLLRENGVFLHLGSTLGIRSGMKCSGPSNTPSTILSEARMRNY